MVKSTNFLLAAVSSEYFPFERLFPHFKPIPKKMVLIARNTTQASAISAEKRVFRVSLPFSLSIYGGDPTSQIRVCIYICMFCEQLVLYLNFYLNHSPSSPLTAPLRRFTKLGPGTANWDVTQRNIREDRKN